MEYEIVELIELSGEETRLYSVVPRGDQEDLFTQFVRKWNKIYPDEVREILGRLSLIGNRVGAREGFFKHDEGKPGDGVCALYDRPNAHLRLFCIRYGAVTVILGSGGPKKVRAWQDDPTLKREAERMIAYARDINRRLREGYDLFWSDDRTELLGELKNYDDEEDE